MYEWVYLFHDHRKQNTIHNLRRETVVPTYSVYHGIIQMLSRGLIRS